MYKLIWLKTFKWTNIHYHRSKGSKNVTCQNWRSEKFALHSLYYSIKRDSNGSGIKYFLDLQLCQVTILQTPKLWQKIVAHLKVPYNIHRNTSPQWFSTSPDTVIMYKLGYSVQERCNLFQSNTIWVISKLTESYLVLQRSSSRKWLVSQLTSRRTSLPLPGQFRWSRSVHVPFLRQRRC